MKLHIISVATLLSLLCSCGNNKIEHCTNEYDPVAKGNVDSLNNAQKGEVISEIPEAGIAEQVLDEADKLEKEETDSVITAPLPSDIDESGELIAPEKGGEVSISEKVEQEEIGEINRRTSEEAKKEQAERQRRAIEQMGN